METRQKKITLILLVITLVGLLYISQRVFKQEVEYNVPIVRIIKGEDKYEIKTNTQNKETTFTENGVEYKLRGLRSQSKARIELPKMDKIQGYNTLEGKKAKGVMLWGSKFNESVEYVKYLQEKGYTISMQIETPDYIELYLSKEGQGYRRIIIQRGEIMVGDMYKQVELPSIWGYIETYTTEEEIVEIKKMRDKNNEEQNKGEKVK